MVGPLAGYTPDPIYGDQQQRFNIYRPKDLATSGYCHPILVWANGHTDNPEPNPPLCVTDSAANKWCGQYLPMAVSGTTIYIGGNFSAVSGQARMVPASQVKALVQARAGATLQSPTACP